MRVLVLEDNAQRMDWFEQVLIGCEVYWAWTVDKAIAWLEHYDFDAIFLDHDLCDEHYTYLFEGKELTPDLLESTGRKVAEWLRDNPNRSPKARIVIHTLNEAGRNYMASCVKGRKCDVVPFTQLKKRLRIIP